MDKSIDIHKACGLGPAIVATRAAVAEPCPRPHPPVFMVTVEGSSLGHVTKGGHFPELLAPGENKIMFILMF